MLFQLSNGDNKTHSGVMEFSAEEGKCYVPHWMMQVRTNVSHSICTSRGNDAVCVCVACRRTAVQCRSTAVSLCRRMGIGGKTHSYTRVHVLPPSLFPPLPPFPSHPHWHWLVCAESSPHRGSAPPCPQRVAPQGHLPQASPPGKKSTTSESPSQAESGRCLPSPSRCKRCYCMDITYSSSTSHPLILPSTMSLTHLQTPQRLISPIPSP
jgi:hypothetical protein